MRNALYNLLRHDYYLRSLGVEETYGSPTIDTPPESVFLVIRWEESTPAFKGVGTSMVAILAHNREADFERIDNILNRVKTLMASAVHLVGSDGVLAQAEWQGDSTDLADDGWGTYTKSASFNCNRGVG